MADEAWQLSDDAAEIYETKMVPIALAEWAPRTADAAAVKKGNRVLDTACGTGLVSRECAQRGAKVTGLDLNEGMLKVAGRISPDIDWHLGDVGDLQFEDGAFDASVCQFGLMYFPEPEKAIREMWRVLAPGGRMAVTVWNTIEHMSALPALVRIIEQIVGEEAGQTMRAPFLLGDTSLLTRIFATAGIADVDIETFPGTARFESIDDFVETETAATPLASMFDEDSYTTFLDRARAEFPGFHLGGRGFKFATSAHVVSAVKS